MQPILGYGSQEGESVRLLISNVIYLAYCMSFRLVEVLCVESVKVPKAFTRQTYITTASSVFICDIDNSAVDATDVGTAKKVVCF